MKFSFTAKNFAVTDALKEKTTQKLSRLSRLVPEGAEVSVTFSVVKAENKIEVTIPLHKRILRAEVIKNDMYAAIDEVVDVLEKQMVKYRNRLRDRSRRDNRFKDEYNVMFDDTAAEENHAIVIEKSKKFALKPMDAEEAVMEMELLGHEFYAFRNSSTDDVNVIYKRKNGTYGLIEPEY